MNTGLVNDMKMLESVMVSFLRLNPVCCESSFKEAVMLEHAYKNLERKMADACVEYKGNEKALDALRCFIRKCSIAAICRPRKRKGGVLRLRYGM